MFHAYSTFAKYVCKHNVCVCVCVLMHQILQVYKYLLCKFAHVCASQPAIMLRGKHQHRLRPLPV